MQRIVIKFSRQVKRKYGRTIRKIKDARLKTRYLIILNSAESYSRRTIARMLSCSASRSIGYVNGSPRKVRSD
jgi:hypothetical protein